MDEKTEEQIVGIKHSLNQTLGESIHLADSQRELKKENDFLTQGLRLSAQDFQETELSVFTGDAGAGLGGCRVRHAPFLAGATGQCGICGAATTLIGGLPVEPFSFQ